MGKVQLSHLVLGSISQSQTFVITGLAPLLWSSPHSQDKQDLFNFFFFFNFTYHIPSMNQSMNHTSTNHDSPHPGRPLHSQQVPAGGQRGTVQAARHWTVASSSHQCSCLGSYRRNACGSLAHILKTWTHAWHQSQQTHQPERWKTHFILLISHKMAPLMNKLVWENLW